MRSIRFMVGLLSACLFAQGAIAGLSERGEWKIGVLIPVTGGNRLLAAQVTAGVKHGIATLQSNWSDGGQIRLVTPDSSFPGPKTREAFDHLASQGVDAVIGGVTPGSADELLIVAAASDIPTIVLECCDAPTSAGLFSENILRIGRSREEVYREGVVKWITDQELKKVAVFYDIANGVTFRYGAEITPEVLEPLKPKIDFIEVFFNGDYIEEYDSEVGDIKASKADGIIVSASPWHAANFVKQVAEKVGPIPIYAAPPVDAIDQIEDLASYGALPIFFGTQFSLDVAEEDLSWLAQTVGDGRSRSGNLAAFAAVKAYDAVQVLGNAWKSGPDWPKGGSPWQGVGSVHGLSGWLAVRDDRILVGPLTVDVVEVTP